MTQARARDCSASMLERFVSQCSLKSAPGVEKLTHHSTLGYLKKFRHFSITHAVNFTHQNNRAMIGGQVLQCRGDSLLEFDPIHGLLRV